MPEHVVWAALGQPPRACRDQFAHRSKTKDQARQYGKGSQSRALREDLELRDLVDHLADGDQACRRGGSNQEPREESHCTHPHSYSLQFHKHTRICRYPQIPTSFSWISLPSPRLPGVVKSDPTRIFEGSRITAITDILFAQ
jgi:hypothetical protein